MTFEEAAKAGKVVVVAGAGISKDSPANLPSWWDYNIILLECIGQMGSKALGSTQNLLDMEVIKKGISVTSVSEFFVDRIAGKHYYPLLSMLDGAQPNMHHFMLAQLFDLGIIHAIVTTNFDTLIERAFEQKRFLVLYILHQWITTRKKMEIVAQSIKYMAALIIQSLPLIPYIKN